VAEPMCCLYRPDLTRLAARLARVVLPSGFCFVFVFFIELIV